MLALAWKRAGVYSPAVPTGKVKLNVPDEEVLCDALIAERAVGLDHTCYARRAGHARSCTQNKLLGTDIEYAVCKCHYALDGVRIFEPHTVRVIKLYITQHALAIAGQRLLTWYR